MRKEIRPVDHLTQASVAIVAHTDEAFWAAVAAQQAAEGTNGMLWRQTGEVAPNVDAASRSGTPVGKNATTLVCALCEDKSPGRWITRCKGPGGGTRQPACSVWVHPACAWQNEGFAMRSIPGSSPTADLEARLPGVFFACPLHDKPATYCSCKREEGEDVDGAEDYIECESCSEWYHFSCEGLDDANPPEHYSCKRCQRLAAKGQKVSAGERRRNQAKTNEYMSQMLANKVMQIQQWVAEVKALAGVTNAGTAVNSSSAEGGEGRYAIMKELIARKEELEAPLEDGEERTGGNAAGSKNGGNGRGGRGTGAGAGSRGGDGVPGAEDGVRQICQGMEAVYGEAVAVLSHLDEKAEAVEEEVDTWFDNHRDDYYSKSDGGTKLGFWATSRENLETEIGDLEILISNVRSVRVWPPATLEAAENALTGARWTLRAICLLAPSGGAVGGGSVKLPAFADVSVLLDTAEEAMLNADKRGRANSAWDHVMEIRSMATQWARRAKTCLRSDGAAAGVTLAVMRSHLSSGAAVPVSMPEYDQLEHVASQWEKWEERAMNCVAMLESVPLEELALTTTVAGENDVLATQLLREADAMTYGIKTSARDAMTRALGRRGWAQRAGSLMACGGMGASRPGIALPQALMVEAAKLGLSKVPELESKLVQSVRTLAEGLGPLARTRELLVTPTVDGAGGLGEDATDEQLTEAEGVLEAMRASPVAHGEEPALALRVEALRWNHAVAGGLVAGMSHEKLLMHHHQVTQSEQLEGVVEGFKSCMPFYTRVSKLNRWQERARRLLETVKNNANDPNASSMVLANANPGSAPEPSLRQRVERTLAECELELKVSGVPEAMQLSTLLQEAATWEDSVRRLAGPDAVIQPTVEAILHLADVGSRMIIAPQVVEALRWRASCVGVASQGATDNVESTKVTGLLAAGNTLLAWASAQPAGDGMAGAVTRGRDMVLQTTEAGRQVMSLIPERTGPGIGELRKYCRAKKNVSAASWNA